MKESSKKSQKKVAIKNKYDIIVEKSATGRAEKKQQKKRYKMAKANKLKKQTQKEILKRAIKNDELLNLIINKLDFSIEESKIIKKYI